ncbi:hypothetical protein UFOVP978_22 [uncultured Caudovirales phage]|uniref:Major capsid protein GpE n=1 Tax=uncultured Caudovirales phage TaxID=2100421 RepID=A0A6J5Q0P3_9CAUD|nr:hypothetical protein UFOVP978_22 [uncultured Caudovirales phage]
MPQPTRSDVHVNRPLTNISTAYLQSANDFIADKVFPLVSVQKQSDLFFTYPKGEWFRSEVQKRSPSTESAGSGYTISQDSYRCETYAVHKDIDDDVIANADGPLDIERDTTLFITQQMLLKKEQDFLASFMGTSIWGKDLVGNTSASVPGTSFEKWSRTTSTPIDDINNAALALTARTGFRANTLVLTPAVYLALKNNTQILDRIVYTQRGIVTTDIMAAMFDVERILVSYAVQNTAKEGASADPTMDFIKNDGALLCYVNPTPSIMQPAAGYTFAWAGRYGASAYGSRMKRFREEKINSTRIEGEMSYVQKIVGSDLGTWFGTCV